MSAALETCRITLVPVWQLAPKLQRLPKPPVLLCVRGDAALLHSPRALAIVGARRCSPAGSAWAQVAGAHYARRGYLVVSGGAFGIDSAAHRGALLAAGKTLAFVGSAADRLYPRGNAELYQAILAHGGAIASEHPPLTATFKSSHAERNRLIAGLSEALLVVEAAQSSGSMGAAHHARALQRPVWVAPPLVGSQQDGIRTLLARGHATHHGELSGPPLTV